MHGDRVATIDGSIPPRGCARRWSTCSAGWATPSPGVAAQLVDAPTDYHLVSVQNGVSSSAGAIYNPNLWRLTFKPQELVPSTASVEMGAGGELFIEVDLASSRARLAGKGE